MNEIPNCLKANGDGKFHLRLSRSNKGKLCQVIFCRRTRRAGRRVCSGCRSIAWRFNNTETAAYHNLKHHAKLRKIPFGLTREQFHCLAILGGYLEGKGRTKDGLQIDRKDPSAGYYMWNCQVLPQRINGVKDHLWRSREEPEPEEDPF